MTETVATGSFDVVLKPFGTPDAAMFSMSLEKTYQGALSATGIGQMLADGPPRPEFGGYVAMERVTGTLDGRHGSFVLQHSGTIDHGKQSLTISIVPGSGTDELKSIAGTMSIDRTDGQHRYTLRYRLSE